MSKVQKRGTSRGPLPLSKIRPSSEVILGATFTKQGGRIKTWKKRFGELHEEGLYYYAVTGKSGQAKGDDLKGFIPVSVMNDVRRLDGSDSKKRGSRRYQFSIDTTNRSYAIACDTEGQVATWLNALATTLKRFREANPAEQARILQASGDFGLPQREFNPRTDNPEHFRPRFVQELPKVTKREPPVELTADDVKNVPPVMLKDCLAKLPGDESTELTLCEAQYDRRRKAVVKEMMRRDVQDVRVRYEQRRKKILAEIKSRGGTITAKTLRSAMAAGAGQVGVKN